MMKMPERGEKELDMSVPYIGFFKGMKASEILSNMRVWNDLLPRCNRCNKFPSKIFLRNVMKKMK
jgi:hypothetical protein